MKKEKTKREFKEFKVNEDRNKQEREEVKINYTIADVLTIEQKKKLRLLK